MQYKFNAHGHKNILAAHKTTLEFTRDAEVSLKGDCIVGVNADFELDRIKNFVKQLKSNKISITVSNGKINETISADINPNFDNSKELVIRKTDFTSERTFAIMADKAAFELNRQLISCLKDKKSRITVILENKGK